MCPRRLRPRSAAKQGRSSARVCSNKRLGRILQVKTAPGGLVMPPINHPLECSCVLKGGRGRILQQNSAVLFVWLQ